MATPNSVLVEACVESAEAAQRAAAIGAGRIELCSRLDLDGLTPDEAQVELCLASVHIPVNIMIRHRPGDFSYSKQEIAEMCQTICALKSKFGARINGFVFGCLSPRSNNVDVEALDALVAATSPHSVTFHRAFDLIVDQEAALKALACRGVQRILTSGRPGPAMDNLERLHSLVELGNQHNIVVIVCGKVRKHNAALIVATTAARELHSAEPFSVE